MLKKGKYCITSPVLGKNAVTVQFYAHIFTWLRRSVLGEIKIFIKS